MIAALLGFLTPVVDRFFDNKDDADRFKAKLSQDLLQRESELKALQRDVIVAEAQGESWLQRNWRPIAMVSFLGLIWFYWMGFAPEYVTQNPAVVESVFELLKIGIGGYIVGRSGEKIVKNWKKD